MSLCIVGKFKMVRGLAPLPPVLEEIAELCGLDVSIKIAFNLGGRSFYFPCGGNKLADTSPLVAAVGADNARKIVSRFSDRADIPCGPFTASALNLYRFAKARHCGDTMARACRCANTTERNGRRWNALIESGAITNNDFIAFGKAIGDEW
jgi:hypothetical protein